MTRPFVAALATFCFLTASPAAPAFAQAAASPASLPNGQRDFDFEIGTWKTHVARLVRPLSGSKTWAEYDGISIVRPLVGNRANIVELDITGPAGTIRGVSLRLYDPQSRLWSLNFASMAGGGMTPPVVGRFSNGRGEFYGDDTLGDRKIRVRFVITCSSRDTCRFEQAFSGDGGKSWETNWVATDTRVGS